MAKIKHCLEEEQAKEQVTNFILYLYEGYKKFGNDYDIAHVLDQTVKRLIIEICECNVKKVSNNAQGRNRKDLKKAYIPPISRFYNELKKGMEKEKSFEKKDAERWLTEAGLARITKEEHKKLGKEQRVKVSPSDTYEQVGIKLVDEKQRVKGRRAVC